MGLIISTEGAGFPPRGAVGSFKLPFQEQIDFFNQKNPLPSNYYDDILKSAHDRAFIVAGAAKADLLNDLHNAVKQTINDSKTIDWFRGQFDSIVKKHGWTGWTGENSAAGVAWRTRVIYQTNLSTSYAAGRWAQLNDPDLLKVRPNWKYIHNDSVVHPRELHKSWNGVVLPHDHPWWLTHFCPNGWGCRCRIMAVRATEYKGHPAPDDGTYNFTDRNGVVHTIPNGIDYGFDYAPGTSLSQDFVTNKAATLPDKLASDFLADTKKIMANDTGYWLPDTDQAAWHEASFKESPDWIKSAIKQHDDKFNGLLPQDVDKSFYYFSDKKAIHTGDADINTYKNQGTWRHEYGHFLDNVYGNDVKYRSSQRDFKKAVTADTRQLLKASGIKASDSFKAKREQRYFDVVDEVAALSEVDRKIYLAGKAEEVGLSLAEVEDFFSRESVFTTASIERDARMAVLLQAIKDQDAAKFMESIIMSDAGKIKVTYELGLVGKFSDLVGSSTVNQLLGHGYMGMGGHATSYYMVAGNAETEVFANLTALFGSDNLVWKTTVESFFPVLSQLFKDIFHGKA
jgi:hypothetical protein